MKVWGDLYDWDDLIVLWLDLLFDKLVRMYVLGIDDIYLDIMEGCGVWWF